MGYYGYHRTSTVEQHLDRGIEEIKSYCQKSQIELKKSIPTRAQERILTDRSIRF